MAKELSPIELQFVEFMLEFCKTNGITAEEFSNAVACVNKEYKKLTLS